MKLYLFLSAMVFASSLHAEVKLASPFGDHMVLQRDQKLPIWGTADPREKVTVRFGGQKRSTRADDSGHWHVELSPISASSKPREFIVTGSRKSAPIKLQDVLVGEVWLCGGQSNMERQLGLREGQKPIVNWEAEVAAANYPQIRQLYVRQKLSATPLTSCEASWAVCSPQTAAEFTAVGYFFARELFEKLDVPIGIIHSSWGGTPAEAWTSVEGLENFPEFNESLLAIAENAKDPAGATQRYNERLEKWYAESDPQKISATWSQPGFDDRQWEKMTLPTLWEDAGHPKWDGLAWFRKTFDLPASWKGGDIELRLSAIDDADTTWVNGQLVGAISGWNVPRAYRIAGSLLKQSGNTIAIRVLDTGGGGGIWSAKTPFEIVALDKSFSPLPLSGTWRCQFASALDEKNRPPVDINQSAGNATVLYNAMIAPLIPYAIRGVAFYQGEANAERAQQYQTLFPAMIADWRQRWKESDFPFLFVQIAPFNGQPPEIREAQLIAMQNTKNTAMVVTIDVGDADDIHPANKKPVGERLALAARALAYGEAVEYSGPIFTQAAFEQNRATVHFTHLGGGLVAHEGELKGFELAGADGKFHPASATIEGDTLVVRSSDVSQPTAVRYAWANVASGNLFNRAGLPASPFRSNR